jgi:hypothetical protein
LHRNLHTNSAATRDQLATQSRYSDLTGTKLVGTTSYGYDAAMRETNLQFKDGSGNNISNFTYSYDPGNRLTAETLAVATLSASTTSYQYNADSELTLSGSLTYGYDANGNRKNTGYTTWRLPTADCLDTLHAGRVPRATGEEGPTVQELCDRLFSKKKGHRMWRGLRPRHNRRHPYP